MCRWLILLALSLAPAWACSCWPTGSPKSYWETHPRAFTGQVTTVTGKPPLSPQTVTIRVDEAFKGVRAGQIIVIEKGGSGCTPAFAAGERWLFFLNPGEPDRSTWEAAPCYITKPLADAADALLFLRALPRSAETTRLAGRVLLHRPGATPAESPVAGLRLRLENPPFQLAVLTDSAGAYEAYDLPPGEYRVTVDLPAGLTLRDSSIGKPIAPSQNVKIAPGAHVQLDLRAIPTTSIRGRVLDPDGRPLRDIQVALLPSIENAITMTNADGSYRLHTLPPGDYHSGGQSRGPPHGDATLPGDCRSGHAH